MGLYNVLKISKACECCRQEYHGKLQFKVGDLRLDEYEVGDRISAELFDGDLSERKIVAYGVLENVTCPFCNCDNKFEEYDIEIWNLAIKGYKIMVDYSPYRNSHEGNYYLKVETD